MNYFLFLSKPSIGSFLAIIPLDMVCTVPSFAGGRELAHEGVAPRLRHRRLVTASRADSSWPAQCHLGKIDFYVQLIHLHSNETAFRVMRKRLVPVLLIHALTRHVTPVWN
jgi:hypothetical protein